MMLKCACRTLQKDELHSNRKEERDAEYEKKCTATNATYCQEILRVIESIPYFICNNPEI